MPVMHTKWFKPHELIVAVQKGRHPAPDAGSPNFDKSRRCRLSLSGDRGPA